MNRSASLTRWLWRWHIIAGLITLPIILLLSITGIIYLFKDDYNQYQYSDIYQVEPKPTLVSYQQQYLAAQSYSNQPIDKIILPTHQNQTSGFVLAGKGHARTTVYVNPYNGNVTGQINQKETGMYLIRKLHGELLLSKAGTYIVELVASWFIVLLITGVYLYWPSKQLGWSSLFTISLTKGKRVFYRQLHTVLGFWLAIFMTIIIAGGMPWTDIFGANLKWVQAKTDSGYPEHWHHSKGLISQGSGTPLSLDQIITQAKQHALPGTITITLAKSPQEVITIRNRATLLNDQHVIHLDQYTGHIVKHLTWHDVGILMDARQIFMRIHQGQYHIAVWWSVLCITLLFTLSTFAGLISYLLRKPKGSLGMIRVPASFKASTPVMVLIALLAIVFPLFGLSVVVILISYFIKRLIKPSMKLTENT